MILPRLVCALAIVISFATISRAADDLQVGFAERDITPEVSKTAEPVWMAGYAAGRKATGVHDPLMVRAVVLQNGDDRVAIASVDLIGLQNDVTLRIRKELSGYKHVTVASTHNHEGPDVIGIWGETVFKRGVNEDYIGLLIARTVECIEEAAKNVKPVTAAFGTAEDESLLDDRRLPVVKDGVLRTLSFTGADGKPAGLLVQWNCHPESIGPTNRSLTGDFPAATVNWLKEKYACPVVYLSGSVGGLMAPPRDRVRNADGVLLNEGSFEYMRVLGEEVGKLADKAIDSSQPVNLVPFTLSEKKFSVQVENRLYRLARQLRVLKREGRTWLGDPYKFGEVIMEQKPGELISIASEVSCLRLGELHIANIPGEIYPELVYGKFQEPVDVNADYPEAPLEPTIADLLAKKKWMLLGLANDEIGYIVPKRQWDDQRPYCFGRERPQYGEVNSCGPDTASTVMKAFADCVKSLGSPASTQLAPR